MGEIIQPVAAEMSYDLRAKPLKDELVLNWATIMPTMLSMRLLMIYSCWMFIFERLLEEGT